MIRQILLVEDDALTKKLLVFLLRDEGYAVDVASSIQEAQRTLEQNKPDLILLDIMLPDGDGITFCRELRRLPDCPPIIMVTARAATAERIAGLEAGADDYIVKPFEPAEVVARVEAVLRRSQRRGSPGYQPRLRVGNLEFDVVAQHVSGTSGSMVLLTPTEARLLECLMNHPGQVVARDKLVDWVWGFQFIGDSNRVEVYVRRLRQKLAEIDQSAAIETVRGVGYRLHTAPNSDRATG